MAIRTVVTRGYGNGTFDGTIALVVTHGYAISVAVAAAVVARPTIPISAPFFRVRVIVSGAAHGIIATTEHADGHVITSGEASGVTPTMARAWGKVFHAMVARGVTGVTASAEGVVVVNREAEDWAILAYLRSRRSTR